MSVLSFFDVLVLIVAAPIMILIGVPAAGYAIAAGAWIALRALGIGVERVAEAASAQSAIGIRLGFMLGRLFALAIAVILVRNADGRDAGLTALGVVVFAFTVYLAVQAMTGPRRASR